MLSTMFLLGMMFDKVGLHVTRCRTTNVKRIVSQEEEEEEDEPGTTSFSAFAIVGSGSLEEADSALVWVWGDVVVDDVAVGSDVVVVVVVVEEIIA